MVRGDDLVGGRGHTCRKDLLNASMASSMRSNCSSDTPLMAILGSRSAPNWKKEIR